MNLRKFLFVLTSTTVFAFSASASLVAHYPLDVDASDASGNGHDGTTIGIVGYSVAGANAATGLAADFAGTTGHIDVPHSAALNPADFTVTLWVNPTAAGGAFRSPITSRDDVAGNSVHGYILYNNNVGVWDFWTGDSGPPGSWDTMAGPAVQINQWSHLAISYDSGSDLKSLYVNGVSVATQNPGGVSPNGTVQSEMLHIGSGQDNGLNFYFDGRIDDVGIFDTALTPAEITDIMNNGVIPEPGAGLLFGFGALLILAARRFR